MTSTTNTFPELRKYVPKPLVATVAVAGSFYSAGESPVVSCCFGALAGVGSYFYPETTKIACTATVGAATAIATKKEKHTDELIKRVFPIFFGAICASGTHYMLSSPFVFSDHMSIGGMNDQMIEQANQIINHNPREGEEPRIPLGMILNRITTDGTPQVGFFVNTFSQGFQAYSIGDSNVSNILITTQAAEPIEQAQIAENSGSLPAVAGARVGAPIGYRAN